MYDYYVYRIELPSGIHEMVVPNSDDDGFTIYIDSRLPDDEAQAALQHALGHINNDDFSKMYVQKIEITAHQLEAVASAPVARQEARGHFPDVGKMVEIGSGEVSTPVAQQEAQGGVLIDCPTNSMPRAKRTRKRRKRYDSEYWQDYHEFIDSCFSEAKRWRIAESQHLYNGL